MQNIPSITSVYLYFSLSSIAFFQFTLNAFDTYTLSALHPTQRVRVTSSKPVSVVVGSPRTNVDSPSLTSDPVFASLPPPEAWGSAFIITPSFVAARRVDLIHVYALSTDVRGFFNSVAEPRSPNFRYHTFLAYPYGHNSNNITTTGGAVLPSLNQLSLSRTQSATNAGDSALMFVPPVDQYLSEYSFVTPSFTGKKTAGIQNVK